MHYYQFSIGDYRAATAHLSNDEDLAYRRLLDMYYDTEQKIPLDTQWVSRRLRVDAHVVRDVLNDMFVQHDDGWFHARCDDVIQQYHAMAEKNRANGRLGGRKKNPVGSDSEPIAKATNNHKPETINQELRTIKEKKGASAEIVFPEGLNQQAWTRWVEYRKAAGKALKPISWPSAMQALVKHGSHQMAVVDQSIANGWQGLFAMKPGAVTKAHADGTPLNKQEALEASNRAVVARLLAKEAQRAGQ